MALILTIMFLWFPEPITNIWREVFIIQILYISKDGFPVQVKDINLDT